MACVFSFIFIFLQMSTCAPTTSVAFPTGPDTPLNAAPSSLTPSPLTPHLPLSPTNLTAASNGNCANPTRYPKWYAANWLVEDCYAALQQLYMKETVIYKNQRFEFFAQGASPDQPILPVQKTPRKYVVSMSSHHRRL